MRARAEPEFVEQAPHETGFAAVFEQEIKPGLLRQEERRLGAVALFWKLQATIAAVALAACVALLLVGESPAWLALPLLVGLALALLLVRLPRLLYREGLRELVMPPLCRFLGLAYERRATASTIDPKRLAALGLFPAAQGARLEDHFVGRWRDTDFELAELILPGRRRRQTFRGLVVRIAVPLPFSAVVAVARDYGELGNQLHALLAAGPGLKPVPTPHPGFETLFEVYADDPAAVPPLLTVEVLNAFAELARQPGGEALTAAFADGACFVVLPQKRDLFELGGPFRSVYRVAGDLHALLFEATVAHRIIDALHGAPAARLL